MEESINSAITSDLTRKGYETYSSATWSPSIKNLINIDDFISNEDKVELIEKILENEDEFMPILKKYLVGYLDKILDNPEPIIKDLIKEKDDKINELNKEVEQLKEEISNIKNIILPLPYNYPPYSPGIGTNPWNNGTVYCNSNDGTYYNVANRLKNTTV